MAVEDIIRDRTQTAPRLKDMAERAARLSRDLRAFAKDHNNWTLAPLPGPYSERPDDQAINQVLGPSSAAFRDIEKAADGLDLVHTFALSRKERIAPPNRNGDVWGIAFATHLGYLWHLLTGKEPSSSSTIFIRFVEQAFISLGGERDAWESQIRTAIENVEARPEWDRFDRLEKAPDPPGTSYITLDDMKARWGRSANAWERDVREAYEQAQNGSEIALRLLALSYAKAGKKGKAFIESLGWRPSPAVRQQFDDDNA
ncbi:hypothetical protein [Microvirga sp. CF3016]|uniref:hypothetical protein n=1 Tax=Microvirga sp. CF3016 TaxID=3110181 RepID=UPI002E77B90A|nr:hypothetical protein [Microvirga sp. CF3016]MEE1612064.1 hypothetical protein [Microvirga sp. CF3016]